MKRYEIKQWAGQAPGSCWCGKKGTATFIGRYYCERHLEQERDRDEMRGAVNIEKEARDEFNASHKLY